MDTPKGPTEDGWWDEYTLIIDKNSEVYRWTGANGRLNVLEDRGDTVLARLWCEPVYDDD